MTEIRLASQYLPLVRDGRKTTSIRRGHRNYPVGPGTIKTATDEVPIIVIGVRHVRLNELTPIDANADGFSSLGELRDALDSFYPRLKHDEPMTIVRFKFR